MARHGDAGGGAPKPIVFLGDSLDRVRSFPDPIRRQAGFELRQVQLGAEPSNWKPMAGIGPGVREVRIRGTSGAFRIIYLAQRPEAVYVLHAFQKQTAKTSTKDLELAVSRYASL